jgi:hypothetical protein
MKKPNSRYDDEPRLDKDGQPVVTFPWAGDIVIFRLLNRYRYLPIDFIVALTGMSYFYLRDRLDLLTRKPNNYLHRNPDQHSRPKAGSRFLIYDLNDRAERFLKDGSLFSNEPRIGDRKLLAHSLMASETVANFELAPGAMIWWPEISARLEKPKRYLPVTISYQFKTGSETLAFEYNGDSNGPFGKRYEDSTPRFFNLETEHRTDVRANNLSKTSFLKKVLAMMYIADNKLYRRAWGIPNLVHLVVCASQHMVDERKDLILELTKGKGLSYVAFAVIPALEDRFAVAKPSPAFFNQGWQRAGHPDLFLSSPTAKAATGKEEKNGTETPTFDRAAQAPSSASD